MRLLPLSPLHIPSFGLSNSVRTVHANLGELATVVSGRCDRGHGVSRAVHSESRGQGICWKQVGNISAAGKNRLHR